MRGRGLRLAGGAALLALAGGLSGCQSTGASPFSAAGTPAGKPIAFESIEGPPPRVRSALDEELASAAHARQVEIVGSGAQPRYRVRGYLTTERTADGGTALAFVWDVFDAGRRRAQRVAGTSPIRVAPRKNPWDGLDKEALARLAAKSMDEIAGFLSADAGAPRPRPDPALETDASPS
jgi:hypothetical protein